ncbi:disease resistance RPP13 protein [Salix suchowensis]|nr:disease resistance RPP13 protein [Salix suchowensis]
MAGEIVLSCLKGAAGFLGQNVASRLLGLFKCRKLDKEKLEKLRETLNNVNGLLNGAEEKQITDAGRDLVAVMVLKTWIEDAEEAIYEAKDLLIEIDNEARRIELEANSKTGMSQARDIFISYLCPLSKNEEGELAHTLEKIFERLEMDQYKEDIKKSLLSDDAEGESLQVIPIVGRPGIGKTTLARFVYHDDAVQKWFDLKAWVSVSQDLDVLKLTKNILKELGFSDCDSMPPNRLHCKLQEILKGNKLLLVLDDFWNDDPEECTFVITPLMAGAKGSKIIITTRERSGASSALQTLHPYLLQTLHPFLLPGISDDNCLLVFSEHAFSGPSCNARLQFENMFSSSVVRRCKGLPLTAKLLEVY